MKQSINIDLTNSTEDKLYINLYASVKELLELDYEIKIKKNKSLLIIDPINNQNYDFAFTLPDEIMKSTHSKVQFMTLMNQIKDTYGRLLRLAIPVNTINNVLPLNYRTTAMLYTTKKDLECLDNDLIEEIKRQLNN